MVAGYRLQHSETSPNAQKVYTGHFSYALLLVILRAVARSQSVDIRVF